MKKELIGTNAGIVWRTLNHGHRKMTFSELLIATELLAADLSAAIGWLARENKIEFSMEDEKEVFAVYHECYY